MMILSGMELAFIECRINIHVLQLALTLLRDVVAITIKDFDTDGSNVASASVGVFENLMIQPHRIMKMTILMI